MNLGKTTTAQMAAESIDFTYINVGTLVDEKKCHTGRDEEFDSYILDEDKLIDEMEPILSNGGCIVDFHSCEIFPERWFELVLVLRTSTECLFDRLRERDYNEKKINENMECEIMQIVLESAKESYTSEIVYELQSNNIEELENNVNRIKEWYLNWQQQN